MTGGWRTARTAVQTTTQRGYGSTHVKERAARAKRHQPTDPCSRCGHPLGPMGPHLHLDHTDDRTGYLGFSHGRRPCPACGAKCNELAASRAGAGAPTTTTRTLRW